MPFLGIVFALTLGIAASRWLVDYSFLAIIVAAFLLITAGTLSLRNNRLPVAFASALGAVLLGGLALGLAERDVFPQDHVHSLLTHNALPLREVVAFDGCIAEEVEHRLGATLLTVELHGFRSYDRWVSCKGRVLLRVPAIAPESDVDPETDFGYGDRIRGWAQWDIPRNFRNPGATDREEFLARREVFLVGRVKSPRLIERLPKDCQVLWKSLAIQARGLIRGNLQHFAARGNQREPEVLASLLIGHTAGVDASTREAFQNAGTYHVLVVSGLHLAWLAWVLIQLCRAVRLRPALTQLLLAAGILVYTCLVGFQASISRCLWMFFLYLAGQAIFRVAAPINLIMVSAFLLLLARPSWLLDVGFQLSFVSAMAILQIAQPGIAGWLRLALQPLHHTGNPARLFVERGVWPRIGRRWRARAEVFGEACGDRCHPHLQPVVLLMCRIAARAGWILGGMILVSVSVQLCLGPILALYFNRLSWIAPLANLVIVPLSSLVLALGMLATLIPAAILPTAFLQGTAWSCALLLKTTEWFAALPGAWQRCPTPSPGWVWTAVFVIFAWSSFSRRRIWIPCLGLGLLVGCLAYEFDPIAALCQRVTTSLNCFFPERARTVLRRELRLTFLDVGQGDSIIIQFPGSEIWVLDAGGIREPASEDEGRGRFDIGESVVSRYLWAFWIGRIDRLVLSHPHQDHAGGMPALLRNFPVRRLDYGQPGSDAMLERVLGVALDRKVKYHKVSAGQHWLVGDVTIRVLNPADDAVGRSVNDSSVVLRLEWSGFSALLTGDLEKVGEAEIGSRFPILRSLLLKVAHHGSRSATLDSFLERVRPRWAILSAGRNNPFGHPSKEVLLRLTHHNVRPLLTSDQGAITFVTDGARYVLESHVSGILEQGVLPH